MIIFCSSIESIINLSEIFRTRQPTVHPENPFFLISPSALLFDRTDGFFSMLEADAYLENNVLIHYTPDVEGDDFKNFLEIVMYRKIEVFFDSEKIFNNLAAYYFCQKKLMSFHKLIGNKEINKIKFKLTTIRSIKERVVFCKN